MNETYNERDTTYTNVCNIKMESKQMCHYIKLRNIHAFIWPCKEMPSHRHIKMGIKTTATATLQMEINTTHKAVHTTHEEEEKTRKSIQQTKTKTKKKENKNKMEMYPRIRYSFTFVYIFNALALGMKHYPLISVAYYALFSSAFALALKWMRNSIQHGYHSIQKPYRVGSRKTPLYYFNSN